MKRAKWYLGLLLVGILLFVGGCTSGSWEGLQEQIDTLEERITALEPIPPIELMDPFGHSDVFIPIEGFQSQPHIDVVMSTVVGGELTVTLGSNPTTGYQWLEDAKISDESIVKQTSHEFIAPETDMLGVPGKEVWVFKALERGTTTILLEYCRWTGAGLWAVFITTTIE